MNAVLNLKFWVRIAVVGSVSCALTTFVIAANKAPIYQWDIIASGIVVVIIIWTVCLGIPWIAAALRQK